MGQLVAAEARKAGDEIGAIVTSKDSDQLIGKLRGHDAAIDFLKTSESPRRDRQSALRFGAAELTITPQ